MKTVMPLVLKATFRKHANYHVEDFCLLADILRTCVYTHTCVCTHFITFNSPLRSFHISFIGPTVLFFLLLCDILVYGIITEKFINAWNNA